MSKIEEANGATTDAASETCAGMIPNAMMPEDNEEPLKVCVRVERKKTLVEGDLILEGDSFFEGDLVVRGGIFCRDGERYGLKVNGNVQVFKNIDAGDIAVSGDLSARDVNAWSISLHGDMEADNVLVKAGLSARDVRAGNMNVTGDVKARNLDAWDVSVIGNLDAWDVSSKGNVSAHNITVLTLDAIGVSAWGDLKALGKMTVTHVIHATGKVSVDGDISAEFVFGSIIVQKEGCKCNAGTVSGVVVKKDTKLNAKVTSC